MKKKNGGSILTGIGAGFLGAILSTVCLTAAASWLILQGHISEASVNYVCTAVLVASSLLSSILAVKRGGENAIAAAAATAAGYFLLLLSMNAILFEGMYNGVWATMLCIFGSGLCGLFLTVKRKKPLKCKIRR